MRMDRYDVAFSVFILSLVVGLLVLVLGVFVFGWFHDSGCPAGKRLILLPAGKVFIPVCV